MKPKNTCRFLGGANSKVVLSLITIATYFLLPAIFNSGVYAQHNFIQSRFIESPGPFSQTCNIGGGINSDCMPVTDGIVHLRFDSSSARIDDSGTPATDDDRFVFTVQVRKNGTALPYSVGGLGIEYNASAFGENLNTPMFHNNGSGAVSGGQCAYTRGATFTGSADYQLILRDTSPSLLSIFEIATDFTSAAATSESFATIGEEWQDYITFSCLIGFDADTSGSIDAGEGTANAEAGVAFSNRLWSENQVWISGRQNSTTRNRTVLGSRIMTYEVLD